MMSDHWFWLLLTAACVLWYSTVTIFVAVRGMKDIRGMLDRLAQRSAEPEEGNDGE
jgi:hypothetical protein